VEEISFSDGKKQEDLFPDNFFRKNLVHYNLAHAKILTIKLDDNGVKYHILMWSECVLGR
jgi:hypothetical protein